MASIIKIELNLVPGAAPGGIMPRVRVSQGDAQDRILQFELYDGSEVADLTDVVSIFFGGQKPDGNGFTVLCTSQNNLVTGILTPQSTVLAGLIHCKLYLTTATGSVRSATFDMQIDPDPLNDAGTSDTDITAIVAAAGNYAAEAHQSAEDAAASAETAATAGAAAGQAAAKVVVAGKLDKVGGDSKDVVTTFTSSDINADETAIITSAGGETAMPKMTGGDNQGSLFVLISKAVRNIRKLINTVKRIWNSVANTWTSGAEYKAGNVVTYINGHTYICILDHTASSSITPLNATYWEDKTIGDMISSLNSNYANIGAIYNGAWIASTASGINYRVTDKLQLPAGTYIILLTTPESSNSQAILKLMINDSEVPNHFFFCPSLNTIAAIAIKLVSSSTVHFATAGSGPYTFSEISRGRLQAIRIN